ncbi:MAG: hypothetical protein M1831_006623 [Alyxoria varia]|nr:MAG: hypothetical protein M1831_006623 [Alyxoria varia]
MGEEEEEDARARKAAAEALIPQFRFERLLNQGKSDAQCLRDHWGVILTTHSHVIDQQGRRICLLGKVELQPAILLVERAAFSTNEAHLSRFPQVIDKVKNLGANDIYSWFLASNAAASSCAFDNPPDLKVNLIYPCTPQHVAKYSVQEWRVVTETPEIYQKYTRPFIKAQREAGRLNWVYNILDGNTEQEDVILRSHSTADSQISSNEGFLLLPDLNWDRKTITSLHLLAIVERRDLWSLRDLRKDQVPWLRNMRQQLLKAATSLYPGIEADQLKFYFHMPPSYFHLHIHIVHVVSEPGSTQALGKAIGLDGVISQLETMGDPNGSMADVSLTFTLGEASELWRNIFEPLKRSATPDEANK